MVISTQYYPHITHIMHYALTSLPNTLNKQTFIECYLHIKRRPKLKYISISWKSIACDEFYSNIDYSYMKASLNLSRTPIETLNPNPQP